MDMESIRHFLDNYGSVAIFVIVLLEYMNLPGFPAGIIMPMAGLFAAHQQISLMEVMLVSVAAGELGCIINYFIGRYGGGAVLDWYLKKFPKQKPAFDKTFDLIQKKGTVGVFLGKLIPMVRTLIPFPAGIAKMAFLPYSLASLLGVIVWNGVFVGLGYVLGEQAFALLGH